MENEEIAIKAKRYKHPDPPSYRPIHSLVEHRPKGCFK